MSPGRSSNWALAYEGPLLTKADGRLGRSTVYWSHPTIAGARIFAGEAAVSVAAAAQLVLDFGYPVDTVEVEADDNAVDGVAFDPGADRGRDRSSRSRRSSPIGS